MTGCGAKRKGLASQPVTFRRSAPSCILQNPSRMLCVRIVSKGILEATGGAKKAAGNADVSSSRPLPTYP